MCWCVSAVCVQGKPKEQHEQHQYQSASSLLPCTEELPYAAVKWGSRKHPLKYSVQWVTTIVDPH